MLFVEYKIYRYGLSDFRHTTYEKSFNNRLNIILGPAFFVSLYYMNLKIKLSRSSSLRMLEM